MAAFEPTPDGPAVFPFFRVAGTHREIGRQFGEAAAPLIRYHLNRALARLEAGGRISRHDVMAAAMRYRPYVQAYARFLDDEIVGVSEGAGLSLDEAYLLQLRAEAATPTMAGPAPLLAGPNDGPDECTTFAALGDLAADGTTIVGHNADLPHFYRDVGVMLEIVPDDAPAILMLTPAGQVSYIGMNDRGLSVTANYLTCDGWRIGFPRYLLSRIALQHETVDEVIAAIRAIPRASSRNMMFVDAHGGAADLEMTATRDARIVPTDDVLAHSNHYTAAGLASEERADAHYVANSTARLNRIRELALEGCGHLDVAGAQAILRDRGRFPDTLCRLPGDWDGRDVMTFASLVAVPARRELWVAVGPPNQHAYQRHTFASLVGSSRAV
jgi:acyl-CoA:6-aminopenicillanic acid acyl transferase